MKEVSPELLTQITEYLKKRERGEISLLSFFYKEVFERELKINCSSCVEDGVRHLKTFINKKTKPVMEKFIWKGGKLSCTLRSNGTLVNVNQNSCTDALAELIEFNGKYSHLVERVLPDNAVEKKTIAPEKGNSKTLEVIILTSKEVVKEEPVVKKKAGRPKLK
jgi:hypothetical protein